MAEAAPQPPHWRRVAGRVARALGITTGATVAAGIGIGYYVAHVLTSPKRPGPMDLYTMTPFETGVDWEAVQFAPADGSHTVRGWWFPRPETAKVIIGCHGYRGSKSELIGIGSALWRAGFNVLLFDYHGHGEAIGTPVTLGFREVQDFYGALAFARQRVPDARIGVLGYSMGASVAILGSSLRPEVHALVADSPFATHQDVVAFNVTRVLRLPGAPFARIADLFLGVRAGYRGGDVAPVRAVGQIAPRPLLLIHGTADTTIPVEHARQLFAAAGEPKDLWLAEGAEHCGAYFQDRPAYCARIAAFFEQHLAAAEARPGTVEARAASGSHPRP